MRGDDGIAPNSACPSLFADFFTRSNADDAKEGGRCPFTLRLFWRWFSQPSQRQLPDLGSAGFERLRRTLSGTLKSDVFEGFGAARTVGNIWWSQ